MQPPGQIANGHRVSAHERAAGSDYETETRRRYALPVLMIRISLSGFRRRICYFELFLVVWHETGMGD